MSNEKFHGYSGEIFLSESMKKRARRRAYNSMKC
jgi:hypothetical protein